MSKVVINTCFGGFSISEEAVYEYLSRRDLEGTSDTSWYVRHIPRDDETLVALVEEWGERANGSCAKLQVVDLPPGTHYLIDEYDGMESIQTRDGTNWAVARRPGWGSWSRAMIAQFYRQDA